MNNKFHNLGSELPEELREEIQRIADTRLTYIEIMAAAYLQKTQLDPEEVELVEVREGNLTRWFFRKKEGAGCQSTETA